MLMYQKISSFINYYGQILWLFVQLMETFVVMIRDKKHNCFFFQNCTQKEEYSNTK